MSTNKIIDGKKILIVDDEKDVLDSLVELLSDCRIDTALSFEAGKQLLEKHKYDVAILDIMGVNGFQLLEICRAQGTPALMLTAHGLSEDNLKRSIKEGAAYYAPKDEINNIALFLSDVIEANEKNKNVWIKWFERLCDYYDHRFSGTDWRDKDKAFWDKKIKEIPKI